MTRINSLSFQFDWRWAAGLAALVLSVWLIRLLGPVLTPFVAGALIAYLGDPLVRRLGRRMPRSVATSLVFIVMTLFMVVLVLGLAPMLEQQLAALIRGLPQALSWLETQLAALQARVGWTGDALSLEAARDWLRQNWGSAGQLLSASVARVASSSADVAGWALNLAIIPVVAFYLMRDWPGLMAEFRALLPRRVEPGVARLTSEVDTVLGAFLHGQLLVMLSLGLLYALGLALVGVNQAFLIGVFSGIVSFVPYLGLILGMAIALIVTALQFQDLLHLVWVVVVFVVVQGLESTVLTPNLVGDRLGLHPVAVIFAVLAGGQLFGFFGVLLALPAAAVLVVLMRHAIARYRASGYYLDDDPVAGDEARP